MIFSLNSSLPDPYEALHQQLRAHFAAVLGSDPPGLVVAPCRVAGYHFYSNAGFFTQDRERLAENLPTDFEADLAGGFVNVRVKESALRQAVTALSGLKIAPPSPGLASRLHALLALRDDEKHWGEAGCTLAWLLVRGESAGNYQKDLSDAFEAYFREGQVDHEILRAMLARMGENQ